MSGLDPIGRAEAKQVLREERARGATILYVEPRAGGDRDDLRPNRNHERGETPRGGAGAWTPRDRRPRMGDRRRVPAGNDSGRAPRPGLHRGGRGNAPGDPRFGRPGAPGSLERAISGKIFVHSVEPRRETLEEHFVRALRGEGGSQRMTRMIAVAREYVPGGDARADRPHPGPLRSGAGRRLSGAFAAGAG